MATSQGWRDIQRHRRSGIKRLGKPALFAGLLGLVVWFVWILVAPFQHPNTHLVYAVAGNDFSHGIAAPIFALEQYAHLTPLQSALFQSGEDAERIPLISPLQVGSADSPASLRTPLIQDDDAVVIYLAAQELHGAAGLGLRIGGSDPAEMSIEALLERIGRMPGRTKLLILDASTPLVPSDGLLLPGNFASRLAAAVNRTGDRSLWVLNSHSLLESTHSSPALRRTVFGYFAARGLKGDADLNQNRVVDLTELLSYVRVGVGDWVAQITAGNATQTPQLYWGGGPFDSALAAVPIVSVANLPVEDREVDFQKSLAESRQPREHGKWEGVFRERTANRLLPTQNRIRDTLTAAHIPAAQIPTAQSPTGTGLSEGTGGKSAASPPTSSGRNPTEPTAGGAVAAPPAEAKSGVAASGVAASDVAASDVAKSATAPPTDAASSDLKPSDVAEKPLESASRDGKVAPPSTGYVMPSNPVDDPKLLEQLAAAWLVHDQLLESRGDLPRPIDYAPDVWQAYEQQLLTLDQTIRGGWIFETRPLVRVLDEQLLPLAGLLQPTPPGEAEPDRLLARFLERRPAFPSPDSVRSLALLAASGSWGRRFDDQQQQSLQEYETLLREGTGEAFQQWLAKSWHSDFETIAELRPAQQFADLAAHQWPLLKRILRTRRLGERAAIAVASDAREHARVLRADVLRRGGERWVLDRLHADWHQRAIDDLEEAEMLYQQSLQASRARLAIDRWCNDLIAFAPYGVALQRLALADPEYALPTADDISLLFKTLTATRQRLTNESLDVAELETIAAQLRMLHDRLHRAVSPAQIERLIQAPVRAPDAWLIGALLRTPLLPVRSRMQLIAVAREVEAAGLRDYSPATAQSIAAEIPVPMGPHDEGRAARLASFQRQSDHWVQWQMGMISLADPAGPLPAQIVSPALLQQLVGWHSTTRTSDEFPRAYDRLRAATAENHDQWPMRLAGIYAQASDLSDAEERPTKVAQLRRIQDRIRILGIEPSDLFDPLWVGLRLLSASRFDQFAWQAERDRLAMADALPIDREFLAASARDNQLLADSEHQQPSIDPLDGSTIQIESPAEVTFAPNQLSLSTPLTVTNRGAEAADVWLVVDSDPRYLHPHSQRTANVYADAALRDELLRLTADAYGRLQQALSRAAAGAIDETEDADLPPGADSLSIAAQTARVAELRRAAIYPYRPDRADLPATLKLKSGESKTVELTLERTEAVGRTTRLIVRAITATDHVREDTAVVLPDRSAVQVVVEGQPATWNQVDQITTLHPYPNRATPYRVLLRNTRGRDLAATVSVLALQQSLKVAVPSTMLPVAAADRWLSEIGPTSEVAAPRLVTLRGDGTPVELLPAPPSTELPTPPVATPSEAAAGSAAAIDLPNSAAAANAVAANAGVLITHGMLVVVRDEASGSVAIEPVRLSPQRPRRYMQPTVRYDAALGRIEIELTASAAEVVPAAGIPVVARLVDNAPQPLNLTLSGRITPGDLTLRLMADVPPTEQSQVEIEVDVDGFPRAFLFQLRPHDSQVRVAEWMGRGRVRLKLPLAGTALASPLETIEVAAAIDAPVGSFLDSRDQLQIGIDVDRDREFRDESPVVLHADRQVAVRLLPSKIANRIEVVADVDDFKLQVPAGILSDARVNLLGYLRTGHREIWSDPVEIILDGSPPQLGSIRVLPSRKVVKETPLEVSASAHDNNLSGVAGVKVGVALPGTTEFAADPPSVDAVLTPGGAWSATVPTVTLPPGAHTVLLQVVDRVGHLSRPHAVPIEIISAEEMKAEVNRPKVVQGRVMHGNTIAVGATVELFTTEEEPKLVAKRTADEQGEYHFARVPPGTYLLKSQAVIRNNPCNGEQKITVPEGNQVFQPVTLLIE